MPSYSLSPEQLIQDHFLKEVLAENVKGMTYWIHQGADPHLPFYIAERNNLETPLLLACLRGNFEMAEVLIQHGAHFDASWHDACFTKNITQEQYNLPRTLLEMEFGVDYLTQWNSKQKILDSLTQKMRHSNAYQFKHEQDQHDLDADAYFLKWFDLLQPLGIDFNTPNAYGRMLIHDIFSREPSFPLIQHLLDRGARLDTLNQNGETLLFQLIYPEYQSFNLKAATWLLDQWKHNGCEHLINHLSNNRHTAFSFLFEGPTHETFLYDSGEKPDPIPLYDAAFKFLLAEHPHINHDDDSVPKALLIGLHEILSRRTLVTSSSTEIAYYTWFQPKHLRMLIEAGADLNAKFTQGGNTVTVDTLLAEHPQALEIHDLIHEYRSYEEHSMLRQTINLTHLDEKRKRKSIQPPSPKEPGRGI